ncbi:uncharacterized protein FIBRA_02558 [Fibroporia radiculosa]|uniref:DUF6593 domain-containing protein n=1 Tax=Fibroporia radiculosa TaxID=599839 RepID=J4H1X3_9APHY|nr:uncharacterized protein FIBRA_02558 [Fibroporia radiculosa]CCM00524.1 predicted protein [Fibroporia radiculosa]
MLLKFSTSDICQTSLIDCATGTVAFRTTTERPQRPRTGSWSSTSTASSSTSQDPLPMYSDDRSTTIVRDGDENIVAEITWQGRSASLIRVGDDIVNGAAELFDAAFVKIYPDETLLPTRLEYVWRLTADSLTLLDDDEEEIGALHKNCVPAEGAPSTLVPCPATGEGDDYLELGSLPSDEVVEMLVCSLLLDDLRERMFSVARYVYGSSQKKGPLANIRRRASRSMAHLRDSLRRKASS